MQAKDIMTTNVVTIEPDIGVRDIAKRLLSNHISAAPVVERDGRLIGIISEGDLMRRPETGTERHPSWWLFLVTSQDEAAKRFIKNHGQHATDIMTRPVITVQADTPIQEIANLLEKHRIKRVPVVRGNKVVGIVSRANLIRALAIQPKLEAPTGDDKARKAAIEKAMTEAGVDHLYMNIIVMGGVVSVSGLTESETQKEAARVAVESVPGIKEIHNNLSVVPSNVWAAMGAE